MYHKLEDRSNFFPENFDSKIQKAIKKMNEDETTKETEIEKQNKISRSKRERIIRIRQNEINL